ncbi:hypothetical protein ABIE41_000164 [Bosea sp. OAE506]|uniref:hypothetical protein n=1 Tax=Bosea sp. OAE506 TaxID=2663870 RepID=UPI00178A38E4
MIRTVAVACAVLLASGSGAAYLVASRVPTFNDVVHPCVEAECEQAPLLRMQTCLCLAEEIATPFWTARNLVLPNAYATSFRDAMLRTCRASAIEKRGSDRGPTRMSPMPRLTN